MRTALFFAALTASALAGPTGQRTSCALHCNDADIFTYQTGKRYEYDYSVTTSTALLGTFDDDAHMSITAKVHIDVSAPCEYTLRLTEVTLDGSSHTKEFAAAISKSPLRFSFQDGRVESVCSEVTEPAWVLNFKRGVLSTFQNSMTHQGNEDVQETDISGVCTTHYKSVSDDNVITVEKTKDLNSCTGRSNSASYIASSGYLTDSPVQSLPIFKSTNKCNQRIEDGVLRMAECEETHKFRPFSSEEGGAVTTAKTTMLLVSQDRPAVPVTDYQFYSKSLVFEQINTPNGQTQTEVIEKLLNDLEVATHEEILPEVPVLFSTLVASLKGLDYPTLKTIYTNTKEIHSRKFLIDAMPLVGTAAAVGVVRDMFINGDMTDADADVWFTSLAFVKNPTSEMFTALAPLLESNPSQDAMLGTSALVNTYCKIHPDCGDDSGVQQVLRRIERHLGSGCRTVNQEEKMKVLMALKALGNAGRWVNANPILQRCYTEDNDMEVRVAAIEAWRHTPCEYDRSNLLAAFQDETQDTEVRIAAYLAVMTCPTPSFIDTVKDRLTSEGVNQVGSFIWTHMTNLQESAAPGKQWVRELIGEELLQKKFNTEALKFSRNYESSFFMNELNAGAAVESNVIFSSKSFLPRSAMLNLTLDLFGESINLFEVGGRIEGFEAYVERFFGPRGYFPQETVEGIIKTMRQQKPDPEATTLEGILDQATDEPEGSYYLRVFGNELHYNHFHGLENLMKTSGASNPLEILMELARKGDVDYTKSYQLMDAHYTIPTVSGLPVTLTAKGTATLALRMNGNFKAQSLKNINIEGHIHPSAAVQMDGLMVVDAHVTRTGMKISSTLHTSTFLDGKVQIDGGKLVDIAFNTPKEKIEVIDVSTKFFYLEDDQEIQKEVEETVESEGCVRIVSGIEACSEITYTPSSATSPRFPLTGPTSLHLYFKKTDTQTGYILRFVRETNEIRFLFDTPESQVDHKVQLTISKENQAINFDLQTPCISIQGNGEYTWKRNNKNMKLTLSVDNSERYTLETGLQESRGDIMKIEPVLIISSPRGEIINSRGKFQANTAAAKYAADVTVSGVTASPVIIRGSYEGEDKSAGVTFVLDTPIYDINFKGQIGHEENFVTSKADIEYTTLEGDRHMIHHSGLYKWETSEELTTYSMNFVLNPTQFPEKSLLYDYKIMISKGRLEVSGELTIGPITYYMEEVYSYTNENNHLDFSLRSSMKCPYYQFDVLAYKELKIGPNYVNSKLMTRHAPGKEYLLTVDLNKNEDVELSGHISVQCEEGTLTTEVLLCKIASGHYKAQGIAKVITTEEMTWKLEGTVQNKSIPEKVHILMDGNYESPVNAVTVHSGIYADREKATVDFKTDINDQKFSMTIEGTRSSLLVDASIYRHILINAYINTVNEVQKLLVSVEWDKDVDPTKTFTINGELSPSGVGAGFKFAEMEMTASCRLVNNGVELAAMWAPDKRVLAHVHYSLDDTKSLAITVETPFQGWEKQDVSFTVSLKDYEITSRAAATWKNAEQMALTINGKFQPGLSNNALNAQILFSSSFENFERITFTIDHTMAGATINTNIVGLWNNNEMKGNFQLTPNETGVDARATFISPFTEEVLVTLHHELHDMALTTKLEAKYGAETSTITMKGHVDLGDVHDITLVVKAITPLAAFDANIKYTLNEDNIKIFAEGKVGEKQVLLNVNGEKTVTDGSTAVSGDLKFITPLTYPLTATFSHSHDGQQFTSQLEMTRIWSTFGTLKMHAEGHIISKNDIVFTAHITSPAIKASLSFTHKIEDKQMNSAVEVIVNGERINISAGGLLDTVNTLANLHAEVVSTFKGLNDIKVNIESMRTDSAWTSDVTFIKDTLSVHINHSIQYDDILNWENIFFINNMYKLRNKMSHVNTAYTHQLEYMWGAENVQLTATINPRISENSRQVDAQIILASSWTENMKVDLHHEDDGREYKPTLIIEYKPGSIIQLDTTIKIDSSFIYIESSLTTPFWQPLGYKLKVDFQPKQSITAVFIRGANKTKINAHGNWEEGKMGGHLQVHSTHLTQPIIVEASYDVISPEKMLHVAVTAHERYAITASFSGHMQEAKWSLDTEMPLELAHHVKFSGEYHIMTMPLSFNSVLQIDAKNYMVSCKIQEKQFVFDMDLEGKKGNLSGKWNYQGNHANVGIKFISPLTVIGDMNVDLMYDFQAEKRVIIKANDGAAEVNFTGMLADPLAPKIILQITTPLEAFKTLGAEAQWNLKESVKTAEIKAHLNDNQYNWHLEAAAESLLKGYATSKITTTHTGWTALNLNGSFDFTAMPYKVAFVYDKEGVINTFQGQLSIDQNAVNGKIITPITGWEEIALSGDYTYENNHLIGNVELVQGTETYKVNTDILYNSQPKLKLNIKTPIAYVSNIELVLDSTIVEAERNIHMSFIRNDITYSVQLSTQFIHKTGFVKVMANSPIPGYTVVEINAKYDFTKDIKTAEMDLKIEGESRHFSVITQVNDNNVHLDIHTPFEGFETVKMVGDYTVVDGQHSVIATLTKDDQLFDFHFDFSVKTKVVSLKLSTPIAEIQDVQLTAKYDILDTGVDCLVDIKRNEDKIGLNLRAVFTPMKSIFHVAAETPVAGWNKLLLDINYDLVSEKKTAEISVQKDTLINTIKGEGSYNLHSGSFKVETPIEGFDVIGAQYSLSLDDKLDASIKIIKNSEEWMFSAHGEYNEHNIKFELVTPFSILKLLSAAVSYNCTATNKDIKVNIAFNEHNYQLTGIVNLNPTKSDFTLTVTTPIPNYENVSVMLKYDLDNKDELVAVHTAVGEHAYNLLMAGYIEEKLAYFKSELTSPFIGWTDVKFEAKADFTSEDKTLEISLEKDENVKAIAISGKLIGSTMDVNLKTPIVGLQNVRLFSSLDRTKRSLQFNMMSDAAEASLLTSFNSIKLHLRTPFERAEEISWQITKVNEGTYKAEWRRNDNFIIVSVEKQGRKNAFSVEVQSELQGWEFMALAGRLDEETLEGYVSGAVNEEKILVTGSGKIADVGKVNLHIETPSHQYRTLDVNFQYNINLMKAKMELTSSSPNLHLSLRYNTVRNPQQGILLSSSGKITIVSPFVSIRNFHHEYHLQVGQVITADSTMKLNEQEIFKLELKGDVSAKTAHLDIDAHTSDCHTSINYQLQGLSSMTFMFRRQGVSTDKQFRIETSGTGNLPSQGTFDITIKNTFPHTPVTTNIHVDLDSASERKQMTIEVTLQPSKLYRFEIDYGYAAKMGDFNLRITTPDRMMSPWKRISGNFNMQNQDDSYLEINYGETTYTARGKLGIYDSDLMLNLAPTEEEVILQWRFSLEDNDYFLKMGRESKYAMLKLKGTYIDIANVNIEGGFKAGPLMENELLFTSKWNMANAGVFTAEGTFNYGQYHGQHHLEEFTRNAATRSATFAWTATSNISGFNSLSLSGNYDFNNKFVIYGLIRSEDQESKIDINLAELYPEYSHNTVELKFTALPRRYRSMQFTLSHNFRDTANKHVSAIAKLSNREYFVKANWNRSENFDVLNGNIDIQVHNVGNIQITMNFDVSNIDNAHAEVRYSRVSPTSQTNSLNMKWTRKTTSNHFESELALDSTFNMLSHARLYVNAEYSNDFQLSSGLEWNEKMITFIFDMNQDGVSTKLTTPFEHFESIDAKAIYSLSGKTKKVTLQYERGNNKVDMSFTLKATTLKKGNLELILTTPFEVLKNLSINASWKNKSAKLDITRNGTEYNIINGTVDMKASKSSFDLAFTIPGWEAIRFAASYDVQDFLEGSTSNDKEIASLLIDFDGNTLNFNVHGYRNSERLYLELDGNTSFDKLKIFHFKMGSELNTESFEGEFEVKLNEFEFKSNNLYEKRGSNGYYIKTMMDSTLTPLPSLTIGIGRNGAERTVTVGYGEDREITFSVQGKNNYESGFFGTFDIPNYGYEGVRYDVSYGFESDDQLQINFDVELGQNGEKIEAEFVYDSEGVKARLTSPFTGQHTMRVRRSVSEQSFSADAGYNDYNLALRGGFKDEDTKRGAVLEGDIFGNKFLIDFLFQSEGMQYSEGKLIIHTPFRGMENIGGLFTLSNADNKIMAHAEVLLPSYTTPKITGEVNLDLNEKLEGFVTLDVAGEKFILQSKLIGLSLSEGYEGTLQLTTPFHALPHLLLNVSIKMVDWSSLVAKFTVNENTIIAQYTMGESTFKFNLDTMVETVHRQLSLEAVYPSLENLEGVLIVVNGDEVHKLRGNFNIISNRVQGGMELESPLTTVTLKLNFDIAIPNASYDHIIFNVSLTTSETYSLFFELDATTDVLVTVKIDTPVLPKLKATLQLAAAQAALKIETPQGVHEIHVTWRLTMDLPVDWLATLHLVSPLLTEEYTITLMLNGEKANMMLKGDLQVGDVKHAIEGKSVMTDTSGELSLNIETPYKNINRLALAASMSFGEKIEMHINGTQADNVNTLDVIFDTINKSFRAMVSSPLIPTGQVSIEALLTGNMGTNMKLKMALKYGDNTISGVLVVKLLSPENMSTILKITTPFKGYKQMNFVARYLKDEVTNIVLSLDKPLRINVELHLSNKHDTIMADMKIETAIENFEMIKAKVEIPLSVFAPSVLVNVDLDDTSYGANLGLRTKAPYELALGCHATDVFSGKFHLRMDSSFLSVLA